MKSFISFFLVLLLVFTIVILLFLILLNSATTVPVAISEEIKLMELGFTMKSVNSLLVSKTPIGLGDLGIKANVSIPIIDLIAAANFVKEQSISNGANSTVHKVSDYYLNRNISFGYCVRDSCYRCSYIIVYPTAYGNIKMCQISFSSLVATTFNCGKT